MERQGMKKLYEVLVEEVMDREDLPLIEREAEIERVLELLTQKTHAWVTESKQSKRVVGVITEHDVLDILSPKRPHYVFGMPNMRALHRGTAESVMHRNPVYCGPRSKLREALEKMHAHGIRRLPVLERDKTIVGEIRLYHILKQFIKLVGKS